MDLSGFPQRVKTLFISDLHLGHKISIAPRIVDVLDYFKPDKLYLVGDVLDETRLNLIWFWPPENQVVLDKIVGCAEDGVEVLVVPGNHDPCFRQELPTSSYAVDAPIRKLIEQLVPFERREYFRHRLQNGREILVTHGDLFDDVHDSMFGIPQLGSSIFDRISRFFPRPLVLFLRWIFKLILAKPNLIEKKVLQFVRQKQADGIVYGHLHRPELKVMDGFWVANCGDWSSNTSFIIETDDGQLQLGNFGKPVSRLSQ